MASRTISYDRARAILREQNPVPFDDPNYEHVPKITGKIEFICEAFDKTFIEVLFDLANDVTDVNEVDDQHDV